MLCFSAAIAEAGTPGMTAYREGNYGAAARLLQKELKDIQIFSDDYFERIFALVESEFYTAQLKKASDTLDKIKSKVPEKFKTRFLWLEAQCAYLRYDHAKGEKLLDQLLAIKNLPPDIRCDAATLQSQIYLHGGKASKAVALLDKIASDPENLKKNEFSFRLMQLRVLAAAGQLNRIPVEFDKLKSKYPDQQDRLQHFELLIHAINQDMKKYHELFGKIFPEERALYAYVGDPVLYQGSLLAEQQSQKEKNIAEISFHLKNQTVFSPTDDLRIQSWKNLIQLNLDNKQPQKALEETRNMLKKIPDIPDKINWEFLCADLQSALKDGDCGLQIYLNIKNNPALKAKSRADAAEKAAAVYNAQNKKSEVLKLYAFIADMPGEPLLNERGLLLTGKFYFENKQYRLGQSLLNRIENTSSLYPEALIYLIQCKIANGEYDSASSDIKKLALLKNDNAPAAPALAANYFQAILLELTGNAEAAAALFEATARTESVKPAEQKMLINSWQKAAEIHFKRQSYSNAGLLFLSFAEHYPKHASALNALYKSVYSYFLAGRYDEMQYSLNKLCKEYPQHELTVNALFHEVDYLRQNDNMTKALQTLDKIEKINNKNNNQTVAVQIVYDRALISYHLQKYDEAMQFLEKLQQFPANPLTSEGLFLAGTIAQEQGNYPKAAEYFRNAAKMREDVVFSQICMGRSADNLFLAGTKNKDNALLKQAAQIYSEQIKNTALAKTFRLQSLYKCGRTLENLEDFQGALDAYTEALYLFEPGSETSDSNIIPVWINKSAVNAVNIHLQKGGSNSLNEALFIIRRLKKLNTMPADELENFEYNTRNRYMNNN